MESIDKKYCCSDFYDVGVNKYGVKCKGWINKIDPYGCFQWYCRYWKGRRSEDDQRQIGRWKRIVNRFVGIFKKNN